MTPDDATVSAALDSLTGPCLDRKENGGDRACADTMMYIDAWCARCQASAIASAVRELRQERDALKARIDKGMDYEHHTSCGHVWTMRHTACPECFRQTKADLAALRQLRDALVEDDEVLVNGWQCRLLIDKDLWQRLKGMQP